MFRTGFLQFAVVGSVVVAAGCASAGTSPDVSARDPNPRATVLVDVHDAAGAPIPGAAVRIAAEASPAVVVGADYTPANGEVKFGGLAPGEYEVVVAPPAGFRLADNKSPTKVSARASQAQSVVLVLTRQ